MRRRRRKDEAPARRKRGGRSDERGGRDADPLERDVHDRLEALALAVAQEPKSPALREERSRLRLETLDLTGALDDVRAWLEATPKDARAHHRRGEVLLAGNDDVGARDAFLARQAAIGDARFAGAAISLFVAGGGRVEEIRHCPEDEFRRVGCPQLVG